MPRIVGRILDEKFPSQWNLKLMGVKEAWKYTTGRDVTVAIVDSGIDGSHYDLGWEGQRLPLSSANSDAYNDQIYKVVTKAIGAGKHPKIVPGWNLISNTVITRDLHRHGTYLAGTVAAESDGYGMVGVAPDCRLMPIVVVDKRGQCPQSRAAEGVKKAVLFAADVILISLGWTYRSEVLDKAIEDAIDKGIICVVATGNRGRNRMLYPAASSKAISVGACDPTGRRWAKSDYGDGLACVAPGSSQPVTFWMRSRFSRAEGTSQAAANIAGVAALVKELHPQHGNLEFYKLLRLYGSNAGVKLAETGWGFPDVGAMCADIAPEQAISTYIRQILKEGRLCQIQGGRLVEVAGKLSDLLEQEE